MRLPYTEFRKNNSAEYLAQLTSNIEIVRDSYFSTILQLYPEILKFVVATVMLLWLSPWIGGYVLLLAAFQLVVPAVFSKRIVETGKRFAASSENYMVTLKENLLSYETAVQYQILDALARRHRQKNTNLETARSRTRLINSLSYEVSYAIGNVMYLGIYVIGAVLSLTGRLGIPAIVAASQLMVYIASPLTTISGDMAELKSSRKIVQQYMQLLTVPETGDGSARPAHFTGSLELRNLSFSYSGRDLFDHLSYTFEKGKKYIIHGASGCGKSTLLKLINRMLSPEGGEITLDGVAIQNFDRKAYAEKLCCIPQEPFLFDDTILENVRLYRDYTEAQVVDALQKAGLAQTVGQLAEGIHTRIGENASFLSGGEKQRLAIARALLSSPEILLVDEGTSHLDPATAQRIESLLFSIPDMTVIAVSHILHPSTVQMADQLLYVSNGKISEEKDECI
jgi:ATP-binding cassette subfamily B protein